ncbi:hypothetical protein HMPREF9607_00788 [Cutibacterium modestum HL044PA1]|uniref:Uncharacterized protein n=1 Tax=Cutibacterium modestum HL044PA1 TaxID=765109 RepID=A0ABN0C6K4_9ACTN|nr:hypothetical protein HMPREF9607_00788 [Cutibacterium modestum HL044PA1]
MGERYLLKTASARWAILPAASARIDAIGATEDQLRSKPSSFCLLFSCLPRWPPEAGECLK